jgi:hypothetical protein
MPKWYRDMDSYDRRTMWTALLSIAVLVATMLGVTCYVASHPSRTTVIITYTP